jgi:hypothetical protein
VGVAVGDAAGRRAASQATPARADENVHVLAPLGPGADWTPSSYSPRLPSRSHLSLMSAGPVIRTVALEELMAAAPISIAPGTVVVTPGTVRLVTVAELEAVTAGTSSGVALSTPE